MLLLVHLHTHTSKKIFKYLSLLNFFAKVFSFVPHVMEMKTKYAMKDFYDKFNMKFKDFKMLLQIS